MFSLCLLSVYFEGVPWERWILRDPSKMRVHARLSFIVTTNLPSFVRLIRCFIGRSKPLGRLEEFGQAVFDKEVKIQRSPGTPSICSGDFNNDPPVPNMRFLNILPQSLQKNTGDDIC